MQLNSGYEQRRPRVEMLPLIDIVFLLLVFFIYAMLSMVVHRGLRVELPGASTSEVSKGEYISITLTRDNALYLNDMPVSMGALAERVVERMAGRRDIPVYINGDKRADLGIAVNILDLLRRAGIHEVSFECAELTP